MTENKDNKTFDELRHYLTESFEWDKYSKMITTIAKNRSLNLSGWKFVKSLIQSWGIEVIVDDISILEFIDKQGIDFSFFKKDVIEDKTEINLFHQATRKKDGTFSIREYVTLQMTNTRNGSVTSKQDYLNNLKCEVLLLQQTKEDPRYQWVGLVDVNNLTIDNIIQTDDQMKINIPLDQIHFVYKGTQKQVDVVEIDFVDLIKKAVKESLLKAIS